MLGNFVDPKYINDTTGLLGYATWGELNTTDPEVDSPYLTCYAGMADIIGDKHFVNLDPMAYGYTTKGMYYMSLVRKFIAYDSDDLVLLRRYPFAGQNYMDGDQWFREKEAHFNNPWNLSGDNTLPIIIIMGELGMTDLVKNICYSHVRRGFFYQNRYTNNGGKKILPDFMLPHLSVFIRSMERTRLTFFILCVTDLMLLINILFHVVYSWVKKDNTASELNYYFPLVQSQRFSPTPLSWLAVILYKYRGKIYKGEPRIHGAIKEFFTIRGDKRPPMHIILRAVTKLYFGE